MFVEVEGAAWGQRQPGGRRGRRADPQRADDRRCGGDASVDSDHRADARSRGERCDAVTDEQRAAIQGVEVPSCAWAPTAVFPRTRPWPRCGTVAWTELGGDEDGAAGALAALDHCLDTLPPRDRELLSRRYERRQGRSAIASALGIGEAAVKPALRRVRSRLLRGRNARAGRKGTGNSGHRALDGGAPR